ELPREEPFERQDHVRGWTRLGVVPDERDPGRAGVETGYVRADARRGDAAPAPLEDLPVRVDEEVVADVAPAPIAGVVLVDAPDDRGRLILGIGVRGHRVVDERHLERRRVPDATGPPALVRAPLRARDDDRLNGVRARLASVHPASDGARDAA